MPLEAPPLGKYGRMRLRYLKEHRPCTYTALLLSGKLYDDLHEADETAQRMLDQLIPEMVLNWIGQGMKEDGLEAITRIGQLFDGNIRASLKRSESLPIRPWKGGREA